MIQRQGTPVTPNVTLIDDALAKVVADVISVWRASGRLERHFVSLGATPV